jgi:hypothetical protein
LGQSPTESCVTHMGPGIESNLAKWQSKNLFRPYVTHASVNHEPVRLSFEKRLRDSQPQLAGVGSSVEGFLWKSFEQPAAPQIFLFFFFLCFS